jgi:gas vesicle protein
MRRVAAVAGRRIALAITAVSLMTAFLVALTPGHAWAACEPLDTSCVADTVEDTTNEAVETVEDAAESAEDTAEEAVDEAAEVAEDAGNAVNEKVTEVVETVEDTVDKTVDTVEDTVDDSVDLVEDAVDTGDDTVDAADPVAPPPPGGSDPGSQDPPRGSPPDTDGLVGRPEGPDPSGPTLEFDLVAGASAAGTVSVVDASTTSPFDPFGPFAGSLPEVARRLAFPLVLLALVVAFVAVQNRLDRKDPKLALAATTPDVLSFG